MESCLSFSRILAQGPAPQVSELSGISAVFSTVPGTLGLSAVTTFLCTQSWQLQMADGVYNECVSHRHRAVLPAWWSQRSTRNVHAVAPSPLAVSAFVSFRDQAREMEPVV